MEEKFNDYLDNYFNHIIREPLEQAVWLTKQEKESNKNYLYKIFSAFDFKKKKINDLELPKPFDFVLLSLFVNEGPINTIISAFKHLKKTGYRGPEYLKYSDIDIDKVIEFCETELTNESILNHFTRSIAYSIKNRFAPVEILTDFDDDYFKTLIIYQNDFNYLKTWIFINYSIDEIRESVKENFGEL